MDWTPLRQLLIGCGNRHTRRLSFEDTNEWSDLTTLDHDENCGADIVHDLEQPWPIDDNSFDEVHAYCVLEHLGRQGDAKSFFRDFGEIWRVLKDGGQLFAICPSASSQWAWGDPSHTRIISPQSLVFLDQTEYAEQVGKTAMTDFRSIWHGDFERIAVDDDGADVRFVLKAHKPIRG